MYNSSSSTKGPVILIVDDDEAQTASLINSIRRRQENLEIVYAQDEQTALESLKAHGPNVAIVDLTINEKIGPESGLKLIAKLLDHDSSLRILVLTGHNADEFGVTAIHHGAASFLQKPVNADHLVALITDGIFTNQLKRDYQKLLTTPEARHGLINLHSANAAMKKVIETAAYAAASNTPVMILGETGTGKGVLANAIYQAQSHHNKKFIPFYPSFISQDLVSSELFGHQKGAFTGATEARIGLLEEAHNGTLFIDEIADLPLETQVVLLSVIQEKRFRRLGQNKEAISDFRLISATNKDIADLQEKKLFRSDLYHRIAYLTIELPALRNRKEDIAALAQQFINKISGHESLRVNNISSSAHAKLLAYDWPGNIRELQACIESAAFHAHYHKRFRIEAEDLGFNGLARQANGLSAKVQGNSFREKIQSFEIQLIKEALNKNNQNQSKAARELQLDRTSLRRILFRTQEAS
ncbi:MAG: sigma-54-dependent Fis family transcriptional regulator [Deltaproteobacteria bacterium]|nr:sigma-54-dependent Fis family transcriptional regulator [Deltaproteobacteria bacterium]